MSDDDWRLIEQAAAANDETISDFVRNALIRAAKRRTKADGDAGN